ncbi:ATP-binding protein [Halobacteriovorax sp. ZH4_bin.1]|uniref:ATP-binding protein n=1 Tax=unclassified Halobacteriovorax TaxID=2639665 RepID=UPI0037224F66
MKIIVRDINQEVIDKLEVLNDLIHVIIGPRQVGKTTSVKQIAENVSYNSFYTTADGEISRSPEWLKVNYNNAINAGVELLIIDEIQKVENWAEALKELWEYREKGTMRVVVLGSSSLDLHRGLSESLAGRFYLHHFNHWSYPETLKLIDISFADYLKYGGYPGSYVLLGSKRDWLHYIKHSIVDAVVSKDILSFTHVKSPALFRQSFDLICSYAAQEISYTKLLGQLQDKGNTDLVKNYIQLFEKAFLIKSLQKFSNKALKKKSSSPKLFPLAPSLFSSALDLDCDDEYYGHAFEISVLQELLKLPGEVYYWRERNAEVDFIYQEGKSIHAIEAKYKKSRSLKGLEAFSRLYPESKTYVVNKDNYLEVISKLSKI